MVMCRNMVVNGIVCGTVRWCLVVCVEVCGSAM